MWTNDFILPSPSLVSSPSSPSSTLSTSPSNISQQPNNLTLSVASVTGAIVGALFGGILISFACFFLYRWNKNRQKQKDTLPIPGSENNNDYNKVERNIYNHGQEIVQPPRNGYTTNHEPISVPTPVINKSYYNHGQESIPIANDSLQEIKQEIQDLRQIILQSNEQSTSSMRNNYNNK